MEKGRKERDRGERRLIKMERTNERMLLRQRTNGAKASIS